MEFLQSGISYFKSPSTGNSNVLGILDANDNQNILLKANGTAQFIKGFEILDASGTGDATVQIGSVWGSAAKPVVAFGHGVPGSFTQTSAINRDGSFEFGNPSASTDYLRYTVGTNNIQTRNTTNQPTIIAYADSDATPTLVVTKEGNVGTGPNPASSSSNSNGVFVNGEKGRVTLYKSSTENSTQFINCIKHDGTSGKTVFSLDPTGLGVFGNPSGTEGGINVDGNASSVSIRPSNAAADNAAAFGIYYDGFYAENRKFEIQKDGTTYIGGALGTGTPTPHISLDAPTGVV